VGPFFGFALPFEDGANAVEADARESLRIEGQLLDGEGQPVPDGLLEVWEGQQFARCRTDPEGAYHFLLRKPTAADGQAPHFNVNVFARGLLRHLVTRLYFPDEREANNADPVLREVDPERTATLIAVADGAVLRFDIRLQGDRETVFFAV
jgi:protocatechuate 3,4-dioxygenase alpha subunit